MDIDGRTLYDLRNEIAHGRLDTLSEAQREQINLRTGDVESIARQYILRVCELVSGITAPLEGVISVLAHSYQGPLLEGIISSEDMYHGPIHMAKIYSAR